MKSLQFSYLLAFQVIFFLVVTSISLNNHNFSRESSQFLDSLYFVFNDKSFITQAINENRVTAVNDTLL